MNELEKLLKAGTPTPWFVGGVRFKMNGGDWHGIMSYNEAKKQDDNVCLVGYDPRTGEGHADARLIVAAVNALPELLAERDRLRELAATVIARLDDFDNDGDNKTDQGEREWYGHVIPALSILRAALNQETKHD